MYNDGMAKKTPTDAAASTPDRHKNVIMSFRPETSLRDAIQSIADAERRSLSQVVEILVEEALRSRGKWPPIAGPLADQGEQKETKGAG